MAISAKFPYESKFVQIQGSKLHYIEQGKGDPILFLHGVPTSNYIWRNIIPALSPYGRCIAPDLIGFGKSDKPDIEYRIFDHIHYIDNFIKTLGLTNITLVLHGLGGVIGVDYALRHPDNIKAIAFMETYLHPITNWNMFSLPAQELLAVFKKYPNGGYQAIIEENFLLEKALPAMVLRKLTHEELDFYRKPFLTPESRRPLWQYVHELPLPHGPQDVKDMIENNSQQLQKSQIPKLMMYAVPGFLATMEAVSWARAHLPNVTCVEVGQAYHCPQETTPEEVSKAIISWYQKI